MKGRGSDFLPEASSIVLCEGIHRSNARKYYLLALSGFSFIPANGEIGKNLLVVSDKSVKSLRQKRKIIIKRTALGNDEA